MLSDIVTQAGEKTPVSFDAYFKDGARNVKIRICAIKKSAETVLKSDERLKRKESRNQIKLSGDTKFVNNYIVVATSLPENVETAQILEIYRLRWQVELYFKRLKSLLDFGDVPNKKEENIIAWLNGKMVAALLLERLHSQVDFSPSDSGGQRSQRMA
jgi:transposase